VAAWAGELTDTQRLGWGLRKRALKRLARGFLPWAVVYRRKMGFTAPIQHWLRGELGAELQERLADLAGGGLFAGEAMQSLLAEHRSGRANHARKLWLLLVYHIWWQAHGRPGLSSRPRWAA
jgi:asparagine synthase (glutamine-hydrolysing)